MPRTRTPSADAVRFGAILRRLREQRGWTRRKLATRAGMTPQYVTIVEQGGNIPSLTTVLELTEVLGADVAEIMRELAAARNTPLVKAAPPEAPQSSE
jgi:transcriptional regulator with XRE-family HTH domain